jgi:hypothetical protein
VKKKENEGTSLQRFLAQFNLEQADPFVVFKRLVTEIEKLRGELA